MLKYWLGLGISVLMSAASQILLKQGARHEYKSFLRQYLNPWVICGYGLLALSTICVIYAYTGLDYKNGPVFEALGLPLVMVLGRVFFSEKFTRNKIIGIVCIFAGVLVYYL